MGIPGPIHYSILVDQNGNPLMGASGLPVVVSGLPGALGAGGGLKVDGSGVALPISGSVVASGTLTIDQTSPNSSNRVTAGLYGKATQPGDTPVLSTTAGRLHAAVGSAFTGGAAITAGTTGFIDTSDTARAAAMAQYAYNGSTNDPIRIPNIFKTATATGSGNTALWTPSAGKKFRLQRFFIQVTQEVASAGGVQIDVTFQDATTALGFGFSFFAPNVSVVTAAGGDNCGWIDVANGYLSALANNVLNINLSAALSSGKVRVLCAGTEE